MISLLKNFTTVALLLILSACDKSEDIASAETSLNAHPFPNHTPYAGNHIKPSNYSQTALDNQTSSFYEEWKNTYLKNDCNADEYYILSGNGAKTVSEAHGYGMMIMGFMAGYEADARLYFDGMVRYYQSHPSKKNSRLMDWKQITCMDPDSADDDAASDGDMDIAFALLVAHAQWGSDGEMNYLALAKALIKAMMQDEINPDTWTVKLGDWSDANDPNYYYGTRASDFITSHFRAFAKVNPTSNWDLVMDECYDLVEEIQNNQSSVSGLMPDFIIHTNTSPIPSESNYLEDSYDGDYYYNACRFPWRIGNDYLLSNDPRAKAAITKINTWLKNSTSGNVSAISNGYLLDGTPINNWNDATFIGPLTVGAMADVTGQDWLNALYDELLNHNDITAGDYYSNTLKLLSMITISGNYWNPEM
ncbi:MULTISPECIES: glycosyl hydrolase family 8 [Mesonia]|uniref:Endoglucanase n=1 Tax=Mesonia oceanica TaxID=2687242 RepID=A0AC61YDZ2_9FLAO|nr:MULTISPECIES: glycosyl hydrolase family 8 [Mesonia]MAN27688.1 beta-glucanase [Mesonia sp.]MAQ40722.1 beta-glucanase [Mesonia sp.]MBJ98838.1 beta-glucanase [Flavobacteriaceae bacterium]VVV02548.1 Endoglucanase [Mesonia oceanica]|tara:strand:+ start:1785 stop:3044 length:1260 start_codon:yes stop_codon:yes gene_type:complete